MPDNQHHPEPLHPLFHKLLNSTPVITDGAWGTQLQIHGLPPGTFPDAWNLSHPSQVAAVARAYVDAGSQIILTNTFGSNRLRLAEAGLAHLTLQLNQLGVEISLNAARGRALVFASIGPSGKWLLNGQTSRDQLRDAFEEQASALAHAGPHALLIETMTDLEEASIAINAARTTRLPVVASMVFDSGRIKDRTIMGVTPEQAARALAQAGADVIGANCGQGIDTLIPICQRLKSASSRPIWIKPNAGLPDLVDGLPVYHTTPDEFAAHAPRLIDAGARFIGGCCGTNPEFIQALHRACKP
jgi:5-methyltetrahydrofolate--homocysteine methyltransferase